MPERLLGEGPTPAATRDPRLSNDVQTEPLEMMGGSGLVSVSLSVPKLTSSYTSLYRRDISDPDASISA